MATPEGAIVEILRGIPGVTNLVGTRIFVDVLPQNCPYPAIRYQRISTERASFRDLAGRSGYAQVRMQVDVFASSRGTALDIGGAILDGIEGYSGIANGLKIDEAWIEDEDGGIDPDVVPGGAPLYNQRLDVMLLGPF